MMLIDSHAHLFLEEFEEDLPQVMERARAASVSHIFMPNIDSSTIEPLLKVCAAYPGYCFPMAGLHPTSVNGDYEKELQIVEQQLKSNKSYVAVGEIGMDLYWDKTYLKEQQMVLDKQLSWALECDLPVVLHCREAFDELFEVLKNYKNTSLRGVFHSFTGSEQDADGVMEYEKFLVGINGVVTFKKSTLPMVLERIPLERLVLETDSPYLTPAPNRGKRNESANVKDVMRKLAEVYQSSEEDVAAVTTRNALMLFGMLK